jgi:DNA-binding GntR family transcriptional regulator
MAETAWGGTAGVAGHQQLSHKVAAHVRERIMIGQLPGGQFIRTEALAAELHVSATPVREALMVLQSEGAVRWEPRRGFRVVGVSEKDVRDLFLVQGFIAGELAARAAGTLRTSEIEWLVATQETLERAAKSGDVALVDERNHQIHRRINTASDSPRLTALLNQTVQYVPLRFFGAVKGWSKASAHDHGAIFDALRAGQGEEARLAMVEHIHHIGDLLIDHLRRNRSG